MPRVFLDTNVLFSGLRSQLGPPADVLRAADKLYRPVISRLVVEELVRNLRRKAPLAVARMERLFEQIEFEVTVDPPSPDVDRWAALGFGTDSAVVAAAVAAEVEYLCTGDKRLRERLRSYANEIAVVSPAELLNHLP